MFRPILDVADELGLDRGNVIAMGRGMAKIDLSALNSNGPANGRLVLVSAITPTKAGEGKTTVSVALAMGLRRLGRRTVVCLREPSLGPVFGIKGGGTGGGKAQVVPADEINLHFTGDIHAVSSAHNLLAALVDNTLHFEKKLAAGGRLDPRRVSWPRVIDMNDRALREIVTGLGGRSGGMARETRFDITAASEVMATLGLASSIDDLRARLGRIVVGQTRDRTDVTADDLEAAPAMVALLQNALRPNLVQTAEGGPALVHGGPFANIAYGCSSLIATKLGLRYADDVVTEAGFDFSLGGEKFLHIKCRQAGLWPQCVVLVVTARALAEHGKGNPDPLKAGLGNLDRHVAAVRSLELEPVVAINVFADDTQQALAAIEEHAQKTGLAVARCTGFAEGGVGAEELARAVAEQLDAAKTRTGTFLYPLDARYEDKIHAVATKMYGATDVDFSRRARRRLSRLDKSHPGLPVCMAKTHLSFSDDPRAGGLVNGFTPTVTRARLQAGAGYVVALMGNMQTMPGLPRNPAAAHVEVLADGQIRGLMSGETS